MKRTLPTVVRLDAGRSGRTSTVLMAVVFAVLGVPVYLLAARTPPAETTTAEAIVRLPAGMTTQGAAQEAIQAEANSRRAPGQASPGELRVWLAPEKAPHADTESVHIQYTARTESISLANRLAEEFAESVRDRQKRGAQQAHDEAKRSTARAAKRLAEAQSRLDRFLQDAFTASEKPTLAAKKVNPDWLAVRRRLDHARRYREQLLVDRTPLHPMVRAADEEIADLEERLAAIPHELVPELGDRAEELREMTEPLPEPPGIIGPAAEDVDKLEQSLGRFTPPTLEALSPATTAELPPAGAPPKAAPPDRRERFLALKHDVKVAQADYERAAAHERATHRRLVNLPPIEVVAARLVTGQPVAASRLPRVSLAALMVALAGAVGVGMVASGIWGGATFADATEARAALSVPILATVPPADHVSTWARRRRLLERWVQVVCGLFLLAVCAGVLLALGQVFARI